ncbi:hypothetical protein F444_18186 [Phytophthora nicotianae P1976]|uniref:RxLR effector protein n=1 Tax=Phytophthora nicotianae P1976 TaxID=1317066 RepID=A0A080ZC72_PHYNI|nr:hypothetical protein F444_18186 [Phytophthora nicotianae P1976]
MARGPTQLRYVDLISLVASVTLASSALTLIEEASINDPDPEATISSSEEEPEVAGVFAVGRLDDPDAVGEVVVGVVVVGVGVEGAGVVLVALLAGAGVASSSSFQNVQSKADTLIRLTTRTKRARVNLGRVILMKVV